MKMKDEGNSPSMGAKLLTPELTEQILETQRECTMIWNTRDGNSAGTMVSFVWHRGSVWIGGPSDLPRMAAIRRNPNMCIVVSVLGTGLGRDRCISLRGECTVHDDPAVHAEMAPRLMRKLGTFNLDRRTAQMVAAPGLVWLEIKPERLFTSDWNDLMMQSLGLESPEPAVM
ncbi:MAG: hypothetical protein OXM56_04135, partial [Gammaproteobacteria bacterium]|nr:hypothetical protein [Gammaproteobacteria bacterium]